jgi:hypothetical protein
LQAEAIVNTYLTNNAGKEERYLRYYIYPTLADAVEKSAMGWREKWGRYIDVQHLS